MEQSVITVVINGNAYNFGAGNTGPLDAIPAAERQQLIALLEAIKEEERRSNQIARTALEHAKSSGQGLTSGGQVDNSQMKPERMGSGDVDALMARLVMEESRDKRPVLTRQGLYKWIAVFAVVIILLVLVF